MDTYLPGKPGGSVHRPEIPGRAPERPPGARVICSTHANNNPVKYVDPSGHAACIDAECNWIINPIDDSIHQVLETTVGLPEGMSSGDWLLGQWSDPLGGEFHGGRFGENRGEYLGDPYCTECDRYHMAIDVGIPEQTPIFPGWYGSVVKINENPSLDLGVYIIVEHRVYGDSYYSVYAHLRPGTVAVNMNDIVGPTTQLAETGSSGTTNPHLHFEVRTPMNVNLKNNYSPLSGQRYWGYDSGWSNDFLDLGVIYGYHSDFGTIPFAPKLDWGSLIP